MATTENIKLAILTNCRAEDQRSMIGYGELLIESGREVGFDVVEFRASSLLANLLPKRISGLPRKLAEKMDRFIVSPLSLIGRKADIIHVVDPGNVIYLPLIRHRHSVATVHDMIPYLARDKKILGFSPTFSGRILMRRIIAQLARVDRIVCVSQSTKRDLLSYVAIPEKQVEVIPNVVFQRMNPATNHACAQFRYRIGVPLSAPIILHVGRGFYKNREAVLSVAAKVRLKRPDVHLVMVGGLTPELESQAKQLDLSDNLHILAHVEPQDMAALYTMASLLLFPSIYEGFGLPVLEAQMCGTPVICSDRGSLPEVAARHSEIVSPNETSKMSIIALEMINGRDDPEMLSREVSTRHTLREWRKNHAAIYTSLRKDDINE